jgi:zona occludens toxin (predicted ATPase)
LFFCFLHNSRLLLFLLFLFLLFFFFTLALVAALNLVFSAEDASIDLTQQHRDLAESKSWDGILFRRRVPG